ncbi:dihydrofolate reductase [Porphyromonas gingivalis]|uniref:Dihydrofolate reductase n=1 Tax=Porphyromonas gingivalis (strain ATCC 33277 / DSM 20709 / CIP 103683 / JCM 12257 / NCTC 11834 / 2561) TaxID=431947 RepID=B2RMI4_PORG3|nr:dihydrofolate reductase [Porphyromonas gingivalis]AIJ34913.1 diacylglycerol kinase [Porphyromonas gingivalis]ALJ26437.1 dihydrofolate reductase [Porphyromonas gingivalis 381]AUR50435.1 dihydrofolate reductase [Porphyromonas gingivalis ATCC 33277]MDR4975790.1 dihydrofolate reductase [Porphyromonas gingivalis]BAG34579.1 probable dihydrofolate reductase [Porphyromonas gingivalis ATCC 33277]
MISIVVAIAENGAIGYKNDLLWHLPADLKRFKEMTTGHSIIMGSRTFRSLPKGALSNRRNIVLSRTQQDFPGAEWAASPEVALELVGEEAEAFVIGGAQVYEQMLPYTDKIYLTRVHADFPEADTFFPELDMSEWVELSRTEYLADEKNRYATTLLELIRDY